ncbi:MAG: NAD-dependent epimerase/dehydratase family protein [Desulfobacterales bacterium]
MDYASILVTGGCGFIGTSLIDKLRQVNSKLSIRVLDNFVTGTSDDLAGITAYTKCLPEECAKGRGVTLTEGDVRNAEIAMQCAKGVDCIVHLAANGVGPSVENPRLDMGNATLPVH